MSAMSRFKRSRELPAWVSPALTVLAIWAATWATVAALIWAAEITLGVRP